MDLHDLTINLREAFPSASIRSPIALLGEGFGSLVVATPDGLVFRIAKHAAAQRGHQQERRFLPVLRQSELGLPIPEIAFALNSSPTFPFGVIGYTKLPGRPLTPGDVDPEHHGRIADQVAEFLRVLHGTNADDVADLGLPRFPPSPDRLAKLWQTVSPYLAQHVSPREHLAMQRWYECVLYYALDHPYTPALIHGDFWYENMLFDDATHRLVGVLDFEHAAIGDPVIDLATQGYVGAPFARAVIDAYYRPMAPPKDLDRRISLLMGLRELLGLEHGIMVGSVDADAVEKVRAAIAAER